eukprot:7404242-Pyramimonas_sp.AAC.1
MRRIRTSAQWSSAGTASRAAEQSAAGSTERVPRRVCRKVSWIRYASCMSASSTAMTRSGCPGGTGTG